MEVAFKMAYEFTRRRGRDGISMWTEPHTEISVPRRRLSRRYGGRGRRSATLIYFTELIPVCCSKPTSVMSPYCYRCPFNRAQPERADARDYRQCHWECLDQVEQKFSARKKAGMPTRHLFSSR